MHGSLRGIGPRWSKKVVPKRARMRFGKTLKIISSAASVMKSSVRERYTHVKMTTGSALHARNLGPLAAQHAGLISVKMGL